jgi:hypothetical protein
MKFVLVFVSALMLLAGCASPETTANVSDHIVDAIPNWLGGEPPGIPPRAGTAEYEAWKAEREREAMRPKSSSEAAPPQSRD